MGVPGGVNNPTDPVEAHDHDRARYLSARYDRAAGPQPVKLLPEMHEDAHRGNRDGSLASAKADSTAFSSHRPTLMLGFWSCLLDML